jgi:hypothetical protein
MTFWTLLEWLAWALCAGIALWLIADMVQVSRRYDEEYLTTGVEAFDEPALLEDDGGLR